MKIIKNLLSLKEYPKDIQKLIIMIYLLVSFYILVAISLLIYLIIQFLNL